MSAPEEPRKVPATTSGGHTQTRCVPRTLARDSREQGRRQRPEGFDDAAIVDLACLNRARRDSVFEFDSAVARAREALGLHPLDDDARTVRAAQALARRWLSGEVDDTQLIGWANVHCDWDEEGPLSALLRMDHEFHSRDVIDKSLAELRTALGVEVARLLDQPDPWSLGVALEPADAAGKTEQA